MLGCFANRSPREEITGFFNLVLVFNKGAAFSMFADAAGWQTPLLAAFALRASGIVTYLILRNPQKRLLCLGRASATWSTSSISTPWARTGRHSMSPIPASRWARCS